EHTVFMEDKLDPSQLDSVVVEVRVGKTLRYFDPATKYCPFGLLPWGEADAAGLRIADQVFTKVVTPRPVSPEAVTRRKATLNLHADGSIEGRVQLAFEGQEALTRLLENDQEDEAGRNKELEETLKRSLPPGAGVKLVSSDGWTAEEKPLQAEFEVQLSNYGIAAGRRMVVALGFFHAKEQNAFATNSRTYPIEFAYPAESYDDITIRLPDALQPEGLPAQQIIDAGAGWY